MQKYVNATQAALEIGISYRTMRRRIEAGQIEAIRGEDGQYSIAVSEVERLKRAQSERPRPAMSGQMMASQERSDLGQRIADLERRVQTLEDAASHVQPSTELQKPSIPVSSSHASTPVTQPQKSIVEPSSDMLSARDFATQIGIEYTLLDGYARRGISGERMDVTEVPHPTRKGYTNRYFSEEQQKKAVELLRKHGKLSN